MTVYQGDLRELVTEPGEPLDRPYILCPLHDDKQRPSMRVYAEGAHCFTCGGHLFRDQFSTLFDARELTSAKLRAGMGRPKLPKRVPLNPRVIAQAAHHLLSHTGEIRLFDYLRARGIAEAQIRQHLLGHNGVAFTLPVFDAPPIAQPDYRVLNVRYRRDEQVAPFIDMKYWGLRGYNDLMLYPWPATEEVVFLTEGEFDALLLRRYGLPAYSWINGSSIMPTKEQWQAFLPNLRLLVRVGDQDEAGRKGSDRILHGAFTNHGLAHRDGFCDLFPHIPVHDTPWDLALGKDVTAVYQEHPEAFEQIVDHLERFL